LSAVADAGADPHPDQYPDGNSDTDSEPHAVRDGDRHAAHCDPNAYRPRDGDRDALLPTDAHAHEGAHTHPDGERQRDVLTKSQVQLGATPDESESSMTRSKYSSGEPGAERVRDLRMRRGLRKK
jgi:hypothetical protein